MSKPREEQLGTITLLDEDGSGTVDCNNARLVNVATPIDATDGVNKNYVDTQVSTVDTLAEILANGNTTDGEYISVNDGYIEFGTSPATSGEIRLGDGGIINANGELKLSIQGIERFGITTSYFDLGWNDLRYSSGRDAPRLHQAAITNDDGKTLTIIAQNASTADYNGGDLVLSSGSTAGGTGIDGYVIVEGGGTEIVRFYNDDTDNAYIGFPTGSSTGADLTIEAQTTTAGIGGGLFLSAGDSSAGFDGNNVTINSGAGDVDGYVILQLGGSEIFRVDEASGTGRILFDASLPKIHITQDDEAYGYVGADLIIEAQAAVYPWKGGTLKLAGGGPSGTIVLYPGSSASNIYLLIRKEGYISWSKDSTGMGLLASTETSGNAQDMEIHAQESSGGNGGDLSLLGGPSSGSNGQGGELNARAGYGNGSGYGGAAYLYGGNGGSTGTGGSVYIHGGTGYTAGNGGSVSITAGNGGASGNAGNVVLSSGTGDLYNGYVSIRDNTDDIVLFGEDLGTDPSAGFYFSKSNNGSNPNALRARSPNSVITTVAPNGTDDGYTQEVIFEIGTVVTTNADETTCLYTSIATNYYGKITVDVTAEDQADPQNAYGYSNSFLISNDAGTATIRDASLTPTEQDPQATGVTATVDTSGPAIRIRVTGNIGENWTWTGMINGLLCERTA